MEPEGFRLRTAHGPDAAPEGPACLTFHVNDAGFSFQQNRAHVGRISPADDGSLVFEVERLLGNWDISENRLGVMFGKGRRLRPRLTAESSRRGQPVPKGRFPVF